MRRDPLDRPDALGEGGRDAYPLTDPVRSPEEARPEIGLDPALGGGIGGGAVVDEVEVQPTRADMGETVRGAGSGIVGTIKANPWPAALTGIGLTWLFVNRRRGSSGQTRYRDMAYDYAPRYEDRGGSGSSAGQALDRAQSRVGDAASQAQDRAGEVASHAQDRAANLAEQARYQARRASGTFQRMLRENPLSVGALAVGTGAAIGLAIPQTTQEHDVMGEARDTLVERAQEKAQEAQHKVQRVAQEAQSAAKEEADNQGITNQ